MTGSCYIAHDQAVSVVRMYLQMAMIGLIVGTGLYCGLMAAFLSHWVSGPIPEVREVDGRQRFVTTPSSPRLPLSAIVKYHVSLNPANYVSTNLNPGRQTVPTELECVFRGKLSTDSGRSCPLIPEEVVQGFRRDVVHFFSSAEQVDNIRNEWTRSRNLFGVKRALGNLLVGFLLDCFEEEPNASQEVVHAQNQRSPSSQV